MSAFISAHAGHADWTIAFASCREQIDRKLQRGQKPNLGWCYLSDYYAKAAGSILAALREAKPGLHWVGAVGVGVGAGAVEYFDEPAMALTLAELPPDSFKVFSALETLEASSDFEPFAALVHAIGAADVPAQLKALSERTASGYLFGGLSSSRSQALYHLMITSWSDDVHPMVSKNSKNDLHVPMHPWCGPRPGSAV